MTEIAWSLARSSSVSARTNMASERLPSAYAALEPDYEIVRELGRGGTALVYLARERATGEDVAIKVIRAKYIEDDEAMARFAREARFVAQLDHPNIVPVRAVVDLGSAGVALVMAHIVGRTLKQVIRDENPISADRVDAMMRQMASALGAAHAKGIVHRDVKPENIFIDAEGRALLADFGLARSMSGNETQLTMTGVAIGTPAYMAPEQIDGGQLDARGDIYSLGLVAWEMLTGHRPWEGESLYAILYHQKYEQLPDVRDIRSDVPDRLADAIAGSIEKDRESRWQDVDELEAALDGRLAARHTASRSSPSNDTIRFARPSSPAPISTISQADAHSAVLAGIAAELEAAEQVPSRPPAKRFVLAGGAVAALLVVGIVATALQGRSNDRGVPSPEVRMPTAASGDVGQPTTSGGSRADSMRASTTGGSSPTNAAGSAPPAQVPPANSSGTRDAAKPVTEPTATVKAVAPPAVPARSSAERVASSAGQPVRAGNNPKENNPNTKATSQARAEQPSATPAGTPSNVAPNPPAPAPVTPAPPTALRATIVAGGLHSCMVSADGHAYCWGGNDHGQLGNGAGTRATAPSLVGSDQRFIALAAGLSHSCGLTREGVAWCWGENDHGQLGDRSTTPRTVPIRVVDSRGFRSVVTGASHSCGLDGSGVAWCWGANSHGQLGDSTARDASAPVPVAGARRFTTIAAGWNFTCGLDPDGHAFCWGDDGAGELGDNATGTDRRLPSPVSGGLSFVSISAGNAHACAVTAQGDAYCWGQNTAGQLGDGTTSNHDTPTRVKSTARFTSITAGGVHTCAVVTGGDAYCWGKNTYVQLGDGGTTDHAQPTAVAGAHAFSSLRAFGSHTCGATVSGEAFCWGYNLDGQLGDGTRTHRTRPVYIEPPGGSNDDQ
jgi:alpha-tubulin suppressor-like RCC1 family protein/tRNA A-37 threonylcarbamoyl transferase component Bud32